MTKPNLEYFVTAALAYQRAALGAQSDLEGIVGHKGPVFRAQVEITLDHLNEALAKALTGLFDEEVENE
jgi:hypothetical protein